MTISYEIAESVATMTLHREEKLKALDYAMIDHLQRQLDVVAADDSIRAVLLTGAGCEITEAAPLAVASERATFAKPEITLGFPPPFGGSQRLPRHAGRKRALEMILTAVPIDARRAEQIGIVNRVVPHRDLLHEAQALDRRSAAPTESAATPVGRSR